MGGVPSAVRPVTAVPRRMRQICAAVAAVVLAAMIVAALTLPESSVGVVRFGVADQVAIGGLGVLLAGGILLLGWARVDADAAGVRVRNILGTHTLPWTAVRAVRLERTSAWATLELQGGEEIALLAVQAVDKERAVAAVEGLRALLTASRTGAGSAPEHRE
ncbi:PH domain-containing protein [Geodermatophilus sp. URMC 64]